jgi:hypothetical protein
MLSVNSEHGSSTSRREWIVELAVQFEFKGGTDGARVARQAYEKCSRHRMSTGSVPGISVCSVYVWRTSNLLITDVLFGITALDAGWA